MPVEERKNKHKFFHFSTLKGWGPQPIQIVGKRFLEHFSRNSFGGSGRFRVFPSSCKRRFPRQFAKKVVRTSQEALQGS